MSSDPYEDSPLDTDSIDRLRRVLIYLRDDLGVPRSAIASRAKIRAIDLDNFTRTRKSSDQNEKPIYKSKTPKLQFQRNALKFILSSDALLDHAKQTNATIKEHIEKLAEHRSKVHGFINYDHLFLHLRNIKAITEDECMRISRKLKGGYYVYRLSSDSNEYVKGYLEVKKYNISDKSPTFIHWKKDRDDKPRISMGTILAVQGKYVFQGFTYGSELSPLGEPLGVKVMIFPYDSNTREINAAGIYLSSDNNGRYEFGAMKIHKAGEIYDSRRIGTYNISKLPPPFRLEEIELPNHHPLATSSLQQSIRYDFDSTDRVRLLSRLRVPKSEGRM